ncbi:MAG: DNA primase [Flavobacterium sp.]
MISKSTIDAVFDAVRVEEVIQDFVQLKRAGSNYKGLSPFSDERSPSFMVSPVKQIWKDFSSGKGGNAIAFIMEHEHFTYPEAIRYLARKYNIEIEETVASEEEKALIDARESMYLVLEYAKKYFHDKMLNSDEGQAIGLSYFKERGFTMDTIKKFSLGFSPEQWDAFSKEALGQGYKLEFLESTGMTINKEDRLTDRFRGRVMFPILSMSGRVLGFGGRILGNDKKAAKYLNSPESDVYHKSKVLYGLFQAKQAIAKLDTCYLVEGYTDVIQMHQAGIENVVSSSGTALSPDQIRLINRLTKNITVLFDGDAAGLRASIRGIDLILEEGMNVKVCGFPEGEDPDSFAKKHSTEQLEEYFSKNSKDFIQFKASLLVDDAKNDPVKKAGLIRDMVMSISKIPDRIQREIYIQECSRIMDISEQVLTSTLAQLVNKDALDEIKGEKKPQKAFEVVKNDTNSNVDKVDIKYELERRIIEILLLYGSKEEDFEESVLQTDEEGKILTVSTIIKSKVYQKIFLSLQEDEVELANPLFRGIYNDIIEYFHQNQEFVMEQYLMRLPVEYSLEVTNILMEEEREHLHKWEVQQIAVKEKDESIAQYVSETILTLRWYLVHGIIDELKGTLSSDPAADNAEILAMAMDYYRLINAFSTKLGRVMSGYR